MDLTIFTIAYNGYGRFVEEWVKHVKNQSIKPKEVIVVLGHDHGLKNLVDGVKFITYNEKATMGFLRNIGLKESTGEHVLYFSVDDVLMENAVAEIQKVLQKSNYKNNLIALKYYDQSNKVVRCAPKIIVSRLKQWERYYIGQAGYVAFTRGISFKDTDFPNYPFLFEAYKQNYRFLVTENPCAIYVKRRDGHGNGGNFENGRKAIKKYIKEYFNIFSI